MCKKVTWLYKKGTFKGVKYAISNIVKNKLPYSMTLKYEKKKKKTNKTKKKKQKQKKQKTLLCVW